MTLNDIIDLNLLNRFLTNLRSLFATKSEVASKQDALMYNATSGTSGTTAVTSSPYCAAIWRVDLSDKVTELYSGLTILLKVPVAGNGTYGTLLRIDGTAVADDSSSNLYPVCANVNSMISTRYAVGCIISLTFDASQVGQTLYYKSSSSSTTAANGTGWTKPGCWKVSDYDTNTTTTYGTLDYYFKPYTGTRLTPYKIVALDKDNRVIPITTEQYCGTYSSTTSYVVDDIVVYDSVYYKCIAAGKDKKPSTSTSYWQVYTMPAQFTPTDTPFRPEKLRFYGSSTLLSAGAATGNQTLTEIGYNTSVCAYTFWATISSYRVIYLQGTYNKTTGLFTLDSGANYYKLVPCNTANITLSSYFTSGKYYILLGSTYSSNNYFQLFMVNTMYYFDGTNLVPYELKLIDDAVATAGDENVIETVKVNGTALTPDANKAVDVTVPTKVSDLNNDSGFISSFTETDPTVPSWAKQNSKPSYNLDEVTDGTNRKLPTKVSDLTNDSGFISSHQSIKNLKTDNTTAQSTSSSEAIAGSGTINLHKVAKTGTYSDLIGTPTIPSASTATPQMDGTGAAGSASTYAKGDHVHPSDTSREARVTTVSHGTNDTTFALTPNVLHTWGTINSLTLTLASGSSTYVDGYWFKFTAGSSFTTLTLPTGVDWVTEPEIEAGKTYEVMIVDGLASYVTDGIGDTVKAKTRIVNHGTSDTTYQLAPNEFHIWGEVASLTLTLKDESTGFVDGYWFRFTCGSTPTVLTLPSSVEWYYEEVEFEANHTYEVTIVEGKACYTDYASTTQVATKQWVQNNTQSVLESGVNIKTINNESILGSGNISIQGGSSSGNVSSTTVNTIVSLTEAEYTALSTKDSSTLYIITSS